MIPGDFGIVFLRMLPPKGILLYQVTSRLLLLNDKIICRRIERVKKKLKCYNLLNVSSCNKDW